MTATAKQGYSQQDARKTLFESASLQLLLLVCLYAAIAYAVAWLFTLPQRDELKEDSCTLRMASFMTSTLIMFICLLFLIAEAANRLEPYLVRRVGHPAFVKRGRLYVSQRIVRMMR